MSYSNPQPKPITFRSKKYLDFIRSKPCCICTGRLFQDTTTTPHHIGLGQSGMATKAPDSHCVPLCLTHHMNHDAVGKDTFWGEYNINVERLIIGYLTEYLSLAPKVSALKNP